MDLVERKKCHRIIFNKDKTAKGNSIEVECPLYSAFAKYVSSYMGMCPLFRGRTYWTKTLSQSISLNPFSPPTSFFITEKEVSTRAVNVCPSEPHTQRRINHT